MVHPPRKPTDDEDDDFSTLGDRVIDFDKLSIRRRALMRNDWGKDTHKGDLT